MVADNTTTPTTPEQIQRQKAVRDLTAVNSDTKNNVHAMICRLGEENEEGRPHEMSLSVVCNGAVLHQFMLTHLQRHPELLLSPPRAINHG